MRSSGQSNYYRNYQQHVKARFIKLLNEINLRRLIWVTKGRTRHISHFPIDSLLEFETLAIDSVGINNYLNVMCVVGSVLFVSSSRLHPQRRHTASPEGRSTPKGTRFSISSPDVEYSRAFFSPTKPTVYEQQPIL